MILTNIAYGMSRSRRFVLDELKPGEKPAEENIEYAGENETAEAVDAEAVELKEVDRDSLPPNIKVDVETPFESNLSSLGCLCFVILFAMSCNGRSSNTRDSICGFLFAAGIFFFVLRYFTDNFYVISTADRRIYFHFKIMFFKKITPFLEPEKIFAVAVGGRVDDEGETTRAAWKYKVYLISLDGKMTEFGDFGPDRKKANERAGSIAAILERPFIENPGRAVLAVGDDFARTRKVTFNLFSEKK